MDGVKIVGLDNTVFYIISINLTIKYNNNRLLISRKISENSLSWVFTLCRLQPEYSVSKDFVSKMKRREPTPSETNCKYLLELEMNHQNFSLYLIKQMMLLTFLQIIKKHTYSLKRIKVYMPKWEIKLIFNNNNYNNRMMKYKIFLIRYLTMRKAAILAIKM